MTEEITIQGLLDNEKAEIEDSIIGQFDNEAKIDDNNNLPPPPPMPEKKNKEQLIKEIQQIEEKLGRKPSSHSKLRRHNKEELLKMIANMMNETLGTPQQNEQHPQEEPQKLTEEQRAKFLNSAAESMFLFHSVLMNISENVSVQFKDKTGGQPALEGLTQMTIEKKQALLDVFREIYLKYPDQIDKYLSPITRYAMITLSTMGHCMANNFLKKKKNLEEN